MYELTDLRQQKDGSWFVQIKGPCGTFIEYIHVVCQRPIHHDVANRIDRLNAENPSWKIKNENCIMEAISKSGEELRKNFYKTKAKALFKRGVEKRDAEYRLKMAYYEGDGK